MPTLVAALLLSFVLAPSVSSDWTKSDRPPDPRFEIYRTIGEWLRQNARPQSKVAAVEVGILGYFSRVPILDLSGLVTPNVIGARSQRHLGQLVAALEPDYILDVPRFRDNVLVFLRDPEILKS